MKNNFLFRCDLYHDLRQKFIGEIIDEIGNIEDEAAMARIWKHMFENFPEQCGKFIIAAYKRRKHFLYNMVV